MHRVHLHIKELGFMRENNSAALLPRSLCLAVLSASLAPSAHFIRLVHSFTYGRPQLPELCGSLAQKKKKKEKPTEKNFFQQEVG